MPVQLALPVLRSDAVQSVGHVFADVLVVVLVQAEGAGRVLDEEVHDADFEVFDLGDLARHFVGDEVAAAGFGGEGELFLEKGHGDCRLWWGLRLTVGVAGGWWAAGAGWELEAFERCEGCSE